MRFTLFPVLVLCLATLSVRAQEDNNGGTSSNVTGNGPSTPPTPTSSAADKPLPWKFLASPMGVLDQDKWKARFDKWVCVDENPKNCRLPSPDIAELIKDTVGQPDFQKAETAYLVIHVDDYHNLASDHWYLYRSPKGDWGDPKWDYTKFTGKRLYGAPSVLFIFVHLNANAISLPGARQAVAEKIKSSKNKGDETKNDFDRALIQIPDDQIDKALRSGSINLPNSPAAFKTLKFCDEASGDQVQWLGDAGIPSSFLNVHYESAVVRRTPANVANLKTILGLLFGAHAKSANCVDLTTNPSAAIWGAGRIDSIPLPSDVSIAGYSVAPETPLKNADRSQKQIGSVGAYNDEQLYWWDASIGIPVHKIKDLQYSDSDNTVTATQVSRQSVYAMFNLMPWPVDISDPHYNFRPRLLVGFPLASSPWDRLFAGGGIGLPWKPFQNFQFFAGATFITSSKPKTLTAGSSADNAQLQNDLTTQTKPKFMFGINVPVKSVIDRLK